MRKKGAQILLDCLMDEKVEVIFGYPGGVVLSIYDRLFDSPLRHILVRHEQAAAHAADGYARATGRVGVCLATSGPGATNLVTGIATAYMDSVPLVAITGQVPTKVIGSDAFQEADIVGISRPITKHNYLVKDVNDLSRIIKEAFYLARTGRPGPVLIDIPRDVAQAESTAVSSEKIQLRGYNPTLFGHQQQIKKAAKAILQAKKPVIYAGGGVIISGASEEMLELAELLQIPVASTLMCLGGFPATHPLCLGMLGMHGTYQANMAVSSSDLLIAVGTRFDDRVTGKIEEFAPEAEIIHIDIDPAAISKNVFVHIPIVGDVKNVLKKLLKDLKEMIENPAERGELWDKSREKWLKQIYEWKEEHPLGYEWSDEVIKPQYVVEQINDITKGNAIIATEVGQNQMWTAQFYKFLRPRTLISSGGLGTMGYGFPASIGAKTGMPHMNVIDIAGDASFLMNSQELATAVQYNINVKVAILNNRYLGMVRQWQELFFEGRYSHSFLEKMPDFVKLAEAYGAVGLRATRPSEVRDVLNEGLSIDRPVVMDFMVDPEECVFPMVPAGAAIKNMIFEKEKKKEPRLRVVG